MDAQQTGTIIEGAEVLGVVASIATIVYLGYKAFKTLADPNTTANKQDAEGNYSGGALEHIANNVLTVGSSSETYSDATTESVLHPIDTFKSIFGIN